MNNLQDSVKYYESGKHCRIMGEYSGWNPGHETEALESIQAESVWAEREEKEDFYQENQE